MIKQLVQEYREGDTVVRTIIVTFFRIPVFKYKKTSTNIVVVRQFTPITKTLKIKGFNNEN